MRSETSKVKNDKTMKKQYIMPQMEELKIEQILLVSGSLGDPAIEPAHTREFETDDLEY